MRVYLKLKEVFFLSCLFACMFAQNISHAEVDLNTAEGLLQGFQLQLDKKQGSDAPSPFAYRVDIGSYQGCTAHIAQYSDATIVTILYDPEGRFAEGTQIISIGMTPVSISTRWKTETINKVQYIKHLHERCQVFSTDLSQFVVFRR